MDAAKLSLISGDRERFERELVRIAATGTTAEFEIALRRLIFRASLSEVSNQSVPETSRGHRRGPVK